MMLPPDKRRGTRILLVLALPIGSCTMFLGALFAEVYDFGSGSLQQYSMHPDSDPSRPW
jgi:hypothetical protein